MAKFTPGPWEASRENNVWGRNNETQVACCRSRPGCGMLWSEDEIKANARLIAAAPQMHAGLESAYQLLARLGESGDLSVIDTAAVLSEAIRISEILSKAVT